MNTKLRMYLGLALLVLALSGCTLLPGAPVADAAEPYFAEAAQKTLAFDVAEDMSRFVFDESPVFEEDGFPAFGNAFITQGYIYPAGTVTCDEDGCNGVNPDGSPEFPDLVLGEWTCRGWFVGDGAHTASGPVVITTQIYNFGDGYGEQMLISDGYELMDVGVPFTRAITGGTGKLADVQGEITQTFLGFNASEGVALRFNLEVPGEPLSLDELAE